MRIRSKIRIPTIGIHKLSAKIILIRGLTPESTLLSQKEIADYLKRPLSSVNYHILRLKEEGIFNEIMFLTPHGKVVFQKLVGCVQNTKKLRAHKIVGTFKLVLAYKDFSEVKNKYIKISNGKYDGFRLDFNECVIIFYTPLKITYYLPCVYGDSISELYTEAYEKFIVPLKTYLETLFPSLKIDQYEIASICINHLALLNHPLAETFKKFNVQYASDRLEIDHSNVIPELETVHKETSVQDMDKILDYEKLIRGSFSSNHTPQNDNPT